MKMCTEEAIGKKTNYFNQSLSVKDLVGDHFCSWLVGKEETNTFLILINSMQILIIIVKHICEHRCTLIACVFANVWCYRRINQIFHSIIFLVISSWLKLRK